MNRNSFLEENASNFGTSLQPREQRLAQQICQLLESFGAMGADEISRRVREKNILVLSLLDKLAKHGELFRLPDGRFSLNADMPEEDGETSDESSSRDTSEPNNRIAQARFLLNLWQWLQAQSEIQSRTTRGIEAKFKDGHLLRIQIGAAGVPTMEIWEPAEDGSPRLAQNLTVWGKIQADRAMGFLAELTHKG